METKRTSGHGGVLALAERGFQQWRRSREGRERILERLWRMTKLRKMVVARDSAALRADFRAEGCRVGWRTLQVEETGQGARRGQAGQDGRRRGGALLD